MPRKIANYKTGITDLTMKNFIKYHLPAILVGIAIVVISSIPNLKTPLPKNFTLGDKFAHIFEYGVFCFLIWWSFSHNPNEKIRKFAAIIAFLIAVLWGAFDEIYQASVPGRLSDSFDWIADCIGAGITQTIIIIKNKSLD